MVRATSRRIAIGTTVIDCHLFLGAKPEPLGTLTVSRGGTAVEANQVCDLAAGEDFLPNFPIATELDSEGAQQKSRITCVAALGGATIFYSE